MTGRVFTAKKHTGAARTALYIVAACLCVWLLFTGLARLGARQAGEQMKVAENAVVRAMVQCYALESRYPPSLAYLEENYGLVLDTDKYTYHYFVNGENLRPVIEVIANE